MGWGERGKGPTELRAVGVGRVLTANTTTEKNKGGEVQRSACAEQTRTNRQNQPYTETEREDGVGSLGAGGHLSSITAHLDGRTSAFGISFAVHETRTKEGRKQPVCVQHARGQTHQFSLVPVPWLFTELVIAPTCYSAEPQERLPTEIMF